jgi:hypothetical protein
VLPPWAKGLVLVLLRRLPKLVLLRHPLDAVVDKLRLRWHPLDAVVDKLRLRWHPLDALLATKLRLRLQQPASTHHPRQQRCPLASWGWWLASWLGMVVVLLLLLRWLCRHLPVWLPLRP